MSAEELSAITGLPAEEAAGFLEMAGGNLEVAVQLFFDMGGAGGGGGGGDGGGDVPMSAAFQAPSSAHSLLFGDSPAPAAWSEQGFEFSSEAATGACIIQHKNGPCGVLAAINGILIAQAGCQDAAGVVSDEALARALAAVLVRAATTPGASGSNAAGKVVATAWSDGPGSQVLETELPADAAAVAAHLQAQASVLRAPGGVVLLCYAAVLSRGADLVRAEACSDGGSLPLVVGPHSLCSTELMGLLLSGLARGNVSAYGSDGGKVSWRPAGDVGMLSRDEIEMGVPLADQLKSPQKPVWVLHGGDHFTLLWAPASSANSGSVDLLFWNGLPPNRGLSRLRLRNASLEPSPPAPEVHVQSHWRAKVGEVESIVQARAEDKKARPGLWRTHSYELALVTEAVVAEDKSAERPEGVPSPVVFPQGAAPAEGAGWRCAACYQTRFKTMCFGENPAPAANACKFCSRPQAEVGWTIWKTYEELPPGVQRRIDRMSGPKMLAILQTRWPADTELLLHDGQGNEVVAGGSGFDPDVWKLPAV
eukprot:TRINITY_DN102911_c0_g1_i1.p1 TRINITY_DN102911_c0_g1~~TRINITY_DN102911_c0_g1_i1.p1  ORF type:complete len:536 (+),score=109.83 TRINITY_DN102911_c0_g1_i1:91-1698(+)